LLSIYAVSLLMMALARVLPSVLTAPFVVVSLSFVPGALLLMALARRDLAISAEHVLYAFGSSLVILMFVGALANVLLPFAGVVRPLTPVPLAGSVTTGVFVLAGVAYWRNPDGVVSVRIPPLWSPAPLALLLLPLLSIIGVTLINATGINLLILAVLIAVSVVPLVAVWRLDEGWHSLAVWTAALAILYHKSLWKYAGFGGRPHGIAAWEAGRWSPGIASIEPYSSELLQNGVLFPLFAHLSDIFIMTQYEVVNPFFVSFIPLALYVTFRQYVRTDVAFLGAALFMFVHPFYYQYPTAGRAATPVLFLALFGVALSNEGMPSGSRAFLAVSFLTGVVVTHYATSYYVAAAFCGALILMYLLWFVDDLAGKRIRRTAAASDGGATAIRRTVATRRSTLFSISTVLFFMSTALGWYLYTRGGWKFDLLPKHVYQNLLTLVTGSTETGRTAARVQESYTSTSIQISKYIYITVAVLIMVGILFVYYRRIVLDDRSFDDYYLSIAASLFGIFGSTLILRNWGGGRPMMITFSFTTVFAALGAVWVTNRIGRASTVVARHLLPIENMMEEFKRRIPDDQFSGTFVFAVLLMVFLLLNTGVVAAVTSGGLAPSNVPAQSNLATNQAPQSQVTVHRETDIVTHVWLVGHLDSEHAVYGDTYAARQFDWYRPDVAARTESLGGGYTSETKPEVFDPERQRTGTQPGYVLIVGHNLELGAVWEGKSSSPEPLENLSINRRNHIYTNGESHIYFYSEPERSVSAASDSPDGEQR
jgi:uncharacterized membrane protein